jgi:hypothetical protein
MSFLRCRAWQNFDSYQNLIEGTMRCYRCSTVPYKPAQVSLACPYNRILKKVSKKKKYLEAYLEQRHHFPPFVCSVDGLHARGREASTFAKRLLAAKLAQKWKRSYSQTCSYVNARLSISIIIRATHCCLRGSRIPTSKTSTRFPQWEDGAGLALFECYTTRKAPQDKHRTTPSPRCQADRRFQPIDSINTY